MAETGVLVKPRPHNMRETCTSWFQQKQIITPRNVYSQPDLPVISTDHSIDKTVENLKQPKQQQIATKQIERSINGNFSPPRFQRERWWSWQPLTTSLLGVSEGKYGETTMTTTGTASYIALGYGVLPQCNGRSSATRAQHGDQSSLLVLLHALLRRSIDHTIALVEFRSLVHRARYLK